MRPCASVSGTRCTRWPPDSNLSFEYAPAPTMRSDHLLVAAELARRRRDDLDLPALALGVARVHAAAGCRRTAPTRRRRCRRGFRGRRCARRSGPSAAASRCRSASSAAIARLRGLRAPPRRSRASPGRAPSPRPSASVALRARRSRGSARRRARSRRARASSRGSGPGRASRPRTTSMAFELVEAQRELVELELQRGFHRAQGLWRRGGPGRAAAATSETNAGSARRPAAGARR